MAFATTAVEAQLDTFSYVSIGHIAGRPINALCASFVEVRFLPDGDVAPVEDTLHIPALAIDSHFQLAA